MKFSKENINRLLRSGDWKLLKKLRDGKKGWNEVGHIKLKNGVEIVHKVLSDIHPNKSVKRGAMTEAVITLLDHGMGGQLATPQLYAQSWKPFEAYHKHWGKKKADGRYRACEVVGQYVPKWNGQKWRADLRLTYDNKAGVVDAFIKRHLSTAPSAFRIAALDMLSIAQDRSGANWITDGGRFYAIDNDMAWFHPYPGGKLGWKNGAKIDNVVLQVGKWQFKGGMFATLWAGKELSNELYEGMKNFNKELFLEQIGNAAVALDFPRELKNDWRFYAILKRMDWMVEHRRLPTPKEYRDWLKGSELMTPPEVVANGGKIVWLPSWDKE